MSLIIPALLLCSCESAEERAARESAELDQKIKARAQAEDAEREKRRAVAEAEQAAKAATQRAQDAAAAAEKAALVERYAKFTPAGRAAALRDACALGCIGDTADAIIAAAPEGEREKLRELKLQTEEKAQGTKRERFADSLDEILLAKRMNPDAVSAIGADKTTLRIKGWFCTRQFMSDFTSGDMGRTAAGMGFKKLQCEGPVEVFTWEL